MDDIVKLKEYEKNDNYLDLARMKKMWGHESNIYTYCNCSCYSHQNIIKGTERHWNMRKSRDNPNYSINEISDWILRWVYETWGDFNQSNPSEWPSSYADVKKNLKIEIIIHPRDNIHRRYVSEKKGGRGPTGIVFGVDVTFQELEDYIKDQM